MIAQSKKRRSRTGRGSRLPSWRVATTAALVVLAASASGWLGNGIHTAGASSAADPAIAAFPPKSNGAWIYDGASRGQWLPVITAYNQKATGEHKITQINTYGSDIEGDADGYETYYDTSMKTGNRDTTSTYFNSLSLGPSIAGSPAGEYTYSPIIDGQVSSEYLKGFNAASQAVAESAADGVSRQICADERVDGIQFDIEPFDVTADGQYYFYRRISQNFAGLGPGAGFGCVDSRHPKGRYFSVFAFAKSIDPTNANSAARVKEVFSAGKVTNGYLVDSLYDLGSEPTGHLNDLSTYQSLVVQEAANMKAWSNRLGIPYAYGIPATASAHEFTSCLDGCVAGSDGSTGNPMLEYTKRAVVAINAAGAPDDPWYIGANVWSLGSFSTVGDFTFYPAPAPADVLAWLADNLPGSRVAGPQPPTTPTAPTDPPPPTTPNLLVNGDFDHGLDGWSCDGTYEVDGPSTDGVNSIKLTPSESTTAVCSQSVPVIPGQSYTVSADLKTSTGVTASIGAKNLVEQGSSAGTFTRVSGRFIPTTASIDVYVQAYRQQDGDVWAQRMTLTRD